MNKQEAILYARVAQLSYKEGQNWDRFTFWGRFDNPGTHTQGIFGLVDGNFVVGFRGSEETGIEDWITDVKFIPQEYPFEKGSGGAMRVHGGFMEAYQSVREALLGKAKEAGGSKIISTGHSLGGALAVLFAADVKGVLPKKEVICYTFGCPKVGNQAYADFYNARVPQTYRVVNGADLVPKIPPAGYEHVGQMVQLGDNKINWRDLVGNINDHFPHNYLKALEAM